MEWKIPLSNLNYDEQEEQAVLDVLRSRWLTMGSLTQIFEEEFAAFTGARHAIAVSNATEALHLACLVNDIGPGTEVIVPSLTFVATANAVLYTGADVRFADILGPSELNISPESIETKITRRTRAILVVHYSGFPSHMDEILKIADRRGLTIIEDAAHSSGAWLNGSHLGTIGDIGCFSFYSNKNLSTGEGGMITTNNDEIAARLKILRSHGMTNMTWDRYKGHGYSYDVVDLGYNYRIDEIRSALGRVQLRKVLTGNARRRAITHQYWHAFEDLGLDLPFKGLDDGVVVRPAYHIMPILIPPSVDRDAFMDAMRARQVQTSIHYPPIHNFTHYRQKYPESFPLPITEDIAAREVTLPLYPSMTDSQVEYVIETVKCALAETQKI